jgi:hypothetical protein
MRIPIIHPLRLITRRTAVAAVTIFETVAAARADGAGDARRLAGDAIRRLDLQTDLPRATEPLLARWHIPVPSELLLALLVIAAAILIYLFLAYARGDLLSVWRRSKDMAEDRAESGAARPLVPAEAMLTADEFARQGRFVEAMHTLLLQALAEIRHRLDERFADSLTSREILRSPRLPEPGRAPLREIIARVEWTYFGEHPAEAADYQACRRHFSEFAEALYGETPA